MIIAYLKLLCKKPSLYLAMLFTALSILLRFFYVQDSADVVNAVNVMLDLDGMRKIMLLFAAFPFNAEFCTEWSTKSTLLILNRKNIKSYAAAHMIAGTVSSFAATFFGILIFAFIVSWFYSLYDYSQLDSYAYAFGDLLEKHHAIGYILVKTSLYALGNSLWCILGMVGSVLFTSPYVAICGPFIFSYIIEKLMLNFPKYTNLCMIYLGRTMIADKPNAVPDYFYSFVFLSVCIGLLSLLYLKLIRRKIEIGMD